MSPNLLLDPFLYDAVANHQREILASHGWPGRGILASRLAQMIRALKVRLHDGVAVGTPGPCTLGLLRGCGFDPSSRLADLPGLKTKEVAANEAERS